MNLQNADVAAFSRERSSVQQQGFVGPPSSSSSSFLLSSCKLKGEERGKIGFRYNLVDTQCKEQTGASCRPPCLLFVCNKLCVVLGKIFARLTMFQYIVERRES